MTAVGYECTRFAFAVPESALSTCILLARGSVSGVAKEAVQMHQNVGGLDRAIRLVLGLVLLTTGLYLHSTLLLIPGAIGLGTGAAGYCPLYLPFGVCTARSHKGQPEARP